MALFPVDPVPSSVSAPAIIDPVISYQVDAGYTVRRSRTSRPRRRYTVEYLGQSVFDLRVQRNFLTQVTRGGALPFQWIHPTARDYADVTNTTPVQLAYPHGLFTGQWVYIAQGPPNISGLFFQVTTISPTLLALNGSTAGGVSVADVSVYLPNAVAIFDQDTWSSPTKLIGPEQWLSLGGIQRAGVFSWTIIIEEVF